MPYKDKKRQLENNKLWKRNKKNKGKEIPQEIPQEIKNFEIMYDYNELSNYLSLMGFNYFQLWMIKQRQVSADFKTKHGFKVWSLRLKNVMNQFKKELEYPKWRYETKECLMELQKHIKGKMIKRKVENHRKMCIGLFV